MMTTTASISRQEQMVSHLAGGNLVYPPRRNSVLRDVNDNDFNLNSHRKDLVPSTFLTFQNRRPKRVVLAKKNKVDASAQPEPVEKNAISASITNLNCEPELENNSSIKSEDKLNSAASIKKSVKVVEKKENTLITDFQERLIDLESQLGNALIEAASPKKEKRPSMKDQKKIKKLELKVNALLAEREEYAQHLKCTAALENQNKYLQNENKQLEERLKSLKSLIKSQATTITSLTKSLSQSDKKYDKLGKDFLYMKQEEEATRVYFKSEVERKEKEWKKVLDKELVKRNTYKETFEDWLRCVKKAGIEDVLGQDIDLNNAICYKSCLYPYLDKLIDELSVIKKDNHRLVSENQKLIRDYNHLSERHVSELAAKEQHYSKLKSKVVDLEENFEQEQIENKKLVKKLTSIEKEISIAEENYEALKQKKETTSLDAVERANNQIRSIRETYEREREALSSQIDSLLKDKVELQAQLGRAEREK